MGWQVKLQQALILLSEARSMLEDADWSNREVGSKGNLLFEKVVLVRVARRMQSRHPVTCDHDLGRSLP